jgi:HlyD family secretion protein
MKTIPYFHFLALVIFTLALTSCGKQIEETTPIRQDVTETVFASGTLQADGFYRLTAQSSGYLTKLHFSEGDVITEGQLLAEIENEDQQINVRGAADLLQISERNADPNGPLLLQAQKNINIAQDKMDQDLKTMVRYQRLLESNSIAKMDVENAELAYQTSKGNYEIALENYQKLKLDAEQQVINSKTNSDLYQSAQEKYQVKALVSGRSTKSTKRRETMYDRGMSLRR